MCGLFGLLDYQRHLSTDERQNILNALAIESEVRGKDATGIAYYNKHRLCVQKAPLPAHLMQFQLPHKASFIMGHTRAATHGLAKDNHNNHPLVGQANGTFSLAHNGVLYNHVTAGDILHIAHDGTISKGAFHYDFYLDYGYPALARGAGDKQTALAYAILLGMEPEEVEMLLLLGYNEYDLDDMLYDAEFRRDCKAEIAEYMYVGGN